MTKIVRHRYPRWTFLQQHENHPSDRNLNKNVPQIIFIVGSPRSGTTILGNVLDRHRDLVEWYEPNYIWDHHFRLAPDDVRTADDATPQVINQIQGDYRKFSKLRRASIIIDKSPRNAIKMGMILKVFPDAKFIHLLRDGRDTTLSISREWDKFLDIHGKKDGSNSLSIRKGLRLLRTWMTNQSAWRYRLRALWHEYRLIPFPRFGLSRQRWDGGLGWGPRFKAWREYRANHSQIEFNAMQWRTCVESVYEAFNEIDEQARMIVRYEDLTQNPNTVMSRILEFIGIPMYPEFEKELGAFWPSNSGKWKNEFSQEELELIRPILTPALRRFEYKTDES